MEYGVALIYLLFRVAFAFAIIILRAIAVLFFSPLAPKRQPRARQRRRGPAPIRRASAQAKKKTTISAAAPAKMVAVAQSVPSRNETDTARALAELGFHKSLAAETARSVVKELGPDAPLNVMVKRGLQLLGPVR